MNSTNPTNSTQDLINIFTERYGKDINNWNWFEISRYQCLTEPFIREFKNNVGWSYISEFQTLSENFIKEFQDKVDWHWISYRPELSEDFIKEFKDKLNWPVISYAQKLSEPFIREFKDEVDWSYISDRQKLSKEFVEEFKDKVNLKEYYLYNPYVTPQEKIKYMRKNGLIEQFDPNKHLLQSTESIEEPKKDKEDKDLQLFKELVQ